MKAIMTALVAFISLVAALSTAPFASSLSLVLPQTRALSFILLNLPHLVCLAVLVLAIHTVLRSTVARMMSPSFSFTEVLKSFALTFLVLTVYAMIRQEGVYQREEAGERLVLFFLVVLITPLQCLAEELMTRVLVARVFLPSKLESPWLKRLAVSGICGLVFLLLHLANSEFTMIGTTGLLAFYYFLHSFLVTLLCLSLGGFETGLGIHCANNIFTAIVLNYTGSVYDTANLFITPGPDLGGSYATLVLTVALATILNLRRLRHHREALWPKGKKDTSQESL